jgi:hypothetical protein
MVQYYVAESDSFIAVTLREQIAPLPLSFASYINSSAAFSIATNVRSTSPNHARPMLPFTGGKSRSAQFTATEILCPASTAASYLISGSRTANSSPPNRATRSVERKASSKALAWIIHEFCNAKAPLMVERRLQTSELPMRGPLRE